MFTGIKAMLPAKFITTLLTLTILSGCGFALRGNIELPPEAQVVWLEMKEKTNSAFIDNFKILVRQNNLQFDESAELIIVVTRANFRRITTTIGSNAEVDEYTLRGELSFDIKDSNDELLASNLEAFSERTFQYDANDAAASNSREAFLNGEVWRDLSQQILRQYAARVRIK